CWSDRAGGSHGSVSVAYWADSGTVAEEKARARNVFCGICRPRYSKRPGHFIRHGDGSTPHTGHQNSIAAPRYSPCSSRCTHSFSSATSNSGEKWLVHITPAKISQATR